MLAKFGRMHIICLPFEPIWLKIIAFLLFSGRSSGVERNLAKVEVEGSNPFARSSLSPHIYTIIFRILMC